MTDCKAQILYTIPENNCCSLAYANVVLFSASEIDYAHNRILVSTEESINAKLVKILMKFYPNIECVSWDNFLIINGNIHELLTSMNLDTSINLDLYPNDCDRLTLLKTFFLTNGRFYYNQDSNKNSKGYNLEFILKDEATADILCTLLSDNGFSLRKNKRQANYVVYTKNSTTICDLLVRIGASYTALDVQNNLAMREMRNNANRQNNCFESNLDKTITASGEQLVAINYIVDNFGLEYLSENLREVALARIANPDVSLQDLRTILNNQISRAGIKYRLDKIIEIYKKLKGEN